MSLALQVQPAAITLGLYNEPQLGYALLTITTPVTGATRPVDWAFIADASRSMQIPIVSETQFRDLVRAGGAQEVLVDGVPVWQLSSPIPPEISLCAPSPLDYVARALHNIVERLAGTDRFTLVACAETALPLVVATSGTERASLVYGIGKLKGLDLGLETDLAAGLQAGLAAVTAGNGAPFALRRLVLLTDGFTRNPQDCIELARSAAAAGISISTLGLGGEFAADLLTTLADLTGGRAVFLRQPEQIPPAVAAEFEAARMVVARRVTLRLQLSSGVTLHRATRISPALAPCEVQPGAGNEQLLYLGDLDPVTPVRILLELLVAPPQRAVGPGRRRLARLDLHAEDTLQKTDLLAVYGAAAPAPPAAVLHGAALANALQLQRRALQTAQTDSGRGSSLLRAAARRFAELGAPDLAAVAIEQATSLEQTGRLDAVGARELTYATRRLGRDQPA